MKSLLFALFLLLLPCSVCFGAGPKPTMKMKGVVLSVPDLESVDWPKLAAENGLNTLATHVFPHQVKAFIESEKGARFVAECKQYGIGLEHQLHAMSDLLPRTLFAEDSTMFRMNQQGRRVADYNCCVHSEKALNLIVENAVKLAKELAPTNHRYYFWLDDNAVGCQCPLCASYTDSEQALMIENRIIKALRKIDPKAMLAHLAYFNTLQAPRKVKPAKGIFLEFAPVFRNWTRPLCDTTAVCTGAVAMTHAQNLKYLRDNLKVFSAKNALVLEYWLDSSLASHYTKPAVAPPWYKEVFLSDMDTYARLGIRNVTTFAVYMDEAYFKAYPDDRSLKEYGECLNTFHFKK